MSVFASDAKLNCNAATLAMLERQAKAWITADFTAAAADWHEEGELTAPGHRVPFDALKATVEAFHQEYTDLDITITSAFAPADGTQIALEWLWAVTRRSDGAPSVTADAIIVDLRDGLIVSWREYFDTAGSVEDHHVSS
ncbi:MAG: nuclear transport factor 2 family protein [Pseudomonadota bacterium]